MRRFSLFALILMVCATTAACASGHLELRTLEQDERDVLRAVIHFMQTGDGGEAAPAVAALSMEVDAEYDYLFPDAEVLREEEVRFPLEVFPDVLRRNRTRAPLGRLVGDDTGARWITEAQMDSVESARSRDMHAEMRLLGQMFPGAKSINWLSRPGFDEPRSHAAVPCAAPAVCTCSSAAPAAGG